jgi:hypothetical protein
MFFIRSMDPASQAPELAAEPLGDTQPPGFPAETLAEQCAMLDELAGIATTVARTMGRQIEAAGRAEPAEAMALAEIIRAARRTIALRNKIVADSQLTGAEIAAALLHREAARAAAHLRVRKTQVRATLEELIEADAAAHGTPPAEAERLVREVRERLLDADIERAFGVEDNSAIILGICKTLGITPRREIWSHRLMQTEISATAAKLRDFETGLHDPGGPGSATGSLPPTSAGLGNGPGPGGSYPKIGRFNFDATGAIASVDPPDEPVPYWLPAEARKPPDSG